MKRQYHLGTMDIERETVRRTIARLKPHPDTLIKFLVDLKENKHKGWAEYSRAKSEVMAHELKGRPAPYFHSNNVGDTRMAAKLYHCHHVKVQPYRALPLASCKTLKEKVAMIVRADISRDIKAELLEAL